MRAHARRRLAPLGILGAFRIRLRVAKRGDIHRSLLGDFRGRASTNEHGLSAPFHRHRRARLHLGQVNLEGRQGQDIRRALMDIKNFKTANRRALA